jgi:hypothetical protein
VAVRRRAMASTKTNETVDLVEFNMVAAMNEGPDA